MGFVKTIKFKKSKKGTAFEDWTGPQVAGILIGVLCILGLAYLGFRLYSSLTSSGQVSQASDSVDYLISQIRSNFTEAQIQGPVGWYITSFPAETNIKKGVYLMPRKCSNAGWSKCICIYKGNIGNPSVQGSVDSIDFTGECRQSDFIVQGTVRNSASGFVNFINKIFDMTISEVEIQNSIQINRPLPLTLEINISDKTISLKGASA